jgi:glycosyltransferase involved in cell wall biosynthesis
MMGKFLNILKNLELHPQEVFPVLSEEIKKIAVSDGIQAAYNRLLQAEVILNERKPKLAIYDHAFHFIGGAQKYGLSMISTLQNQFDITIISNKGISHPQFSRWYDIDLTHCEIKVIELPYFEDKNINYLDPACISKDENNPFHPISKESGNYDFFINNSMNEMVYPLSNISVMVCHFPERRPNTYFYADQYSLIVYNSRYTAEWIKKKWDLTPHKLIYPPVDMEPELEKTQKKKVILSVARFEVEGTKRQFEMIQTFLKLKHEYPKIMEDWTFKLVGGSDVKNPYLQRLENLVAQNSDKNIQLKINIPIEELKSLYQESTLFWHLCGLTHRDPSEIEHFGMTTVEAMQNKSVPIVYDGGGLREIVDHGIDGFRVRSKAELFNRTLKLCQDDEFTRKLSENAQKKSQEFLRSKFEERVHRVFTKLLHAYKNPE